MEELNFLKSFHNKTKLKDTCSALGPASEIHTGCINVRIPPTPSQIPGERHFKKAASYVYMMLV